MIVPLDAVAAALPTLLNLSAVTLVTSARQRFTRDVLWIAAAEPRSNVPCQEGTAEQMLNGPNSLMVLLIGEDSGTMEGIGACCFLLNHSPRIGFPTGFSQFSVQMQRALVRK